MLVALPSNAQKWKVGVTAGGDNNTYCIDTEYQYDWRYKDFKNITDAHIEAAIKYIKGDNKN